MARALCLNVSYEPMGFLSQERAVVVLLEGRADLLEQETGREFRSPSGVTMPRPLVIRLRRYIKMPRTLRENINARVLFARDEYTCQYCGRHQSELSKKNPLTIEHIKPRAQDGPHHWENVVAACYSCNLKKRDRTPFQANMKFVHKYKNKSPKKPHLLVFTWGGKVTPEQAHWIKSYYGVESLSDEIVLEESEEFE